MAWPVFPALIVLAIVGCIAFLVSLAYGVSAYANALANNTPAFWREMRRGLAALAVLLACGGGIVAIVASTDMVPPGSIEEGGKP